MEAPVLRRNMGYVMPYRLINGLMFNLTWFAIVITQSAVWAPVLAVLHLSIHFYWMGKGLAEARVIAVVTLVGVVLDQLLFRVGVFTVDGHSAWPPLWMTCLWPVLGTTLMHVFSGMRDHVLVAAIFGAIGGALSYTAGTRLTAVDFGSAFYGPIILGMIWAVVFPLAVKLATMSRFHRGDVHV